MEKLKESEAKQKICPFLKDYCKGKDCISWKKDKEPKYIEILHLKVKYRLSDDEKKAFDEIERLVDRLIDSEFQEVSNDRIPYGEIFDYVTKGSEYLKIVMDKLKSDLIKEETEEIEGYCILLKENIK